MAKTLDTSNNPNNDEPEPELEEEVEEKTFEELGLDPRLIRREGRGCARENWVWEDLRLSSAMLQKLFSELDSARKNCPGTFVLVPTRELCQQVYAEVSSLIEACRVQLKVVQLTSSMPASDLRAGLAGPPDILVSTPACISTCLSIDALRANSIQDSLSFLVLDEADLLLSYGYEDDLKALVPYVPRPLPMPSYVCNFKLKKLVLHNPFILTLPEVGKAKDEIIPQTVQQYWISCTTHDKLLYILALLKLALVQKKVLIFVNTIDMGYRLRLFLEQFGIKSVVLNAELPQNSRLHILEVINFEMPQDVAGYVHRIGRTGRAFNTGASVSLVSSDEMEIFEEIKITMGDDSQDSSNFIAPFPLLTKNAVESLRYRAEDVARSVTKIAVREARAQDLRNEILNSEKLKAHFESNPRDLDLLKHDKVLSKKPAPAHLKAVPEYLMDATTKEASKIVKLARAAMGKDRSNRRNGSKARNRKSRDPLKTFSAEGPKKSQKSGMKRKDGEKDDIGRKKQRKKNTTYVD
ncbi:hypothetical protein Syun_004503 [Stephania yunnanensis]|uniref:RNA helicase n=1 Tax=Stephania yunnanensis TaxID=152371 RepID=A0AAP0Q507_9MAGN